MLPGHALFAEEGKLVIESANSKAAAILDWPSQFLSSYPDRDDGDERLCVMIWARSRAIPGHSIDEFCREQGIKRLTFERLRQRGLAKIASELNRRGVAI